MLNIRSSKYLNRIKSAYENRPRQVKLDKFLFTAIVFFAVFFFISFSVFIHPEGERFCYNFYLEVGSINILSAATLATASLIAYICFFINPSANKSQKIFFLIVALALTYLAMDEVLQFHEKIGRNLDKIDNFKRITAPGLVYANGMI